MVKVDRVHYTDLEPCHIISYVTSIKCVLCNPNHPPKLFISQIFCQEVEKKLKLFITFVLLT